jgi:glycosyltransferase involved in cell wall biosynthesis
MEQTDPNRSSFPPNANSQDWGKIAPVTLQPGEVAGLRSLLVMIVADGQSPHSRHWIQQLVDQGAKVHLVSTYPCEFESLGVVGYDFLPVDFSAKVRAEEKGAIMGSSQGSGKRRWIGKLRGTPIWRAMASARNGLAPYLAVARRGQLKSIVERVKPDIVHSLRIPFEGILTSQAVMDLEVPFAISTWGNDFTLFAASSRTIEIATRKAVFRADGLHSDCHKDVRLAIEHGFAESRPSLVAPGNGGVDATIFHAGSPDLEMLAELGIDENAPVIVNPRGLKPYIRTDEFFAAIEIVTKQRPDARIICTGMAGKAHPIALIEQHSLQQYVILSEPIPHHRMADQFRCSIITVSPSDHDGTPNTLLEAMACGSFPVAGSIESVREWITHESNGLLCDQTSPESIATQILRAIEDPHLRERASVENAKIIADRAEKGAVIASIGEFYRATILQGKER